MGLYIGSYDDSDALSRSDISISDFPRLSALSTSPSFRTTFPLQKHVQHNINNYTITGSSFKEKSA